MLGKRHRISRLPEVTGDITPKTKIKTYPVGYFHINIAGVQTVEGKLYLSPRIYRTSKFAFVQLVKKASRVTASAFGSTLSKQYLTKSTSFRLATESSLLSRHAQLVGHCARPRHYQLWVWPHHRAKVFGGILRG